MKTAFIFLVAFAVVAFGKHEIYEGNQVYNLVFEFETQLGEFVQYEQENNLDVWTEPVLGLRDGSVMVTREQKDEFIDFMDRLGVRYSLEIEDVMYYLQEKDSELNAWRSQRSNRLVPFNDYPRYAEVDEYLVNISAQYPDIVTLVSAGSSWEGRDIKYVKISTTNFTDTSKPVIYLDAMIHAREWVTTPTALYAIQRLVEELLDEDQDLLDNIDWIILPIVNPDGYEYTHTSTRLWRKTRSDNHTGADTCPGIDANRNFDFEFATLGTSADPCSNTYPGNEPFSEPETAIVRDILFEYLDRIQMYINIHSQGNWFLYGYGNSSIPENSIHLHHVGAAFGAAVDTKKLPQSSYYIVGNSALLLYATSGTAQDYAQYIGVPFSYTLELPGYGYGFLVPPQYIEHINAETWEGIKAASRLSVLYYRVRNANV